MNRIFFIAAIIVLVAAVSARAQDQFDLHQVVIHNSAPDVADWPITVRITELDETPQPEGINLQTTRIPDAWEAHFDGSGGCAPAPQAVTEGCIQYTIWAIANVGGQWHGAAFIQMWRGRWPSGGTLIGLAAGTPMEFIGRSNFHANWAYACDRWPVLCAYDPKPGDQMGFLVTAGNGRDARGVSSVRERSQVVLITVPAFDSGSFSFAASPPPVPPPPAPQPPPVFVPPPVVQPPPVVVAPPPVVGPPAPAPIPADLLTQLAQLIAIQQATLGVTQDTNATVHEMNTTVAQTLGKVGIWATKYVLPAVTAFIAARQMK